jgi:hypothetical protein
MESKKNVIRERFQKKLGQLFPVEYREKLAAYGLLRLRLSFNGASLSKPWWRRAGR